MGRRVRPWGVGRNQNKFRSFHIIYYIIYILRGAMIICSPIRRNFQHISIRQMVVRLVDEKGVWFLTD